MNDNEDCSHDISREGIFPDASNLCLGVYSFIHLCNAVMHCDRRNALTPLTNPSPCIRG